MTIWRRIRKSAEASAALLDRRPGRASGMKVRHFII